jgi:general secretion pathway protein B
MSFILDALKKSETDRQRQTGPALFEVKVAQPKAGFPVWAIAIVVLLVINLVIVGWLLLRRPSKSEADAQPPVVSQLAPTPPTAAAISQPAPTNTAPPPVQSNSGPQQQANSPPPAQERAPQPMSQGPSNSERSEPEEQPPGRGIPERGRNEPTLASGAGGRYVGAGGNAFNPSGGANTGHGADTGATASAVNPDDEAPAQDPGGSPLFKSHVTRGMERGLMLYQDLAVTNGANLPELRLDMHVYDPKPQARFALINMQKVTEGQVMKGEVKVEAITPEGVVMSHNGTKFLLPRD